MTRLDVLKNYIKWIPESYAGWVSGFLKFFKIIYVKNIQKCMDRQHIFSKYYTPVFIDDTCLY